MQKNKANFFFPIIETWPDYFDDPDEGLGTVYERFLLHRFFQRLKREYEIQSVLEAPSFGMTGVSGVNSLWWAKQGIRPVIVDNEVRRLEKMRRVWRELGLPAHFVLSKDFVPLPFSDRAFDFSYNFAALWFVPRLESFLREMSRVTRKVIFISVPNRWGIGYQLRLHWPGNPRPPLHFANIREKNFVPPLAKQGWQLIEKGYFDIPPWPDFPLKKEVLLQKFKLAFLLRRLKATENTTKGRTSIIDYFSGIRPELEREVMKFGFLEGAPWPVRLLWAHHRYYIFTKE